MLALAFLACRLADAGFAGAWQDPLGTCYIRTLVISQPSGHPVADSFQLELQTAAGRQTASARLIGGELVFDLAPGIQGHLWLNAGKELRLYRVFAQGAPDEDIDWKFYRP